MPNEWTASIHWWQKVSHSNSNCTNGNSLLWLQQDLGKLEGHISRSIGSLLLQDPLTQRHILHAMHAHVQSFLTTDINCNADYWQHMKMIKYIVTHLFFVKFQKVNRTLQLCCCNYYSAKYFQCRKINVTVLHLIGWCVHQSNKFLININGLYVHGVLSSWNAVQRTVICCISFTSRTLHCFQTAS